MRLVGIVVVATLSAALIAQGRTSSTPTARWPPCRRVSRRWRQSRRAAGAPAPRRPGKPAASTRDSGDGEPGERRRLPPPKLIVPPPGADNSGAAPPKFRANGEGPGLPPALDNPEAREQMRQFVLSTLDQQRQEQRDRMEQRRDDMMKERRDRQAKELGLSASETQKFKRDLHQRPDRPAGPAEQDRGRAAAGRCRSPGDERPCARRRSSRCRACSVPTGRRSWRRCSGARRQRLAGGRRSRRGWPRWGRSRWGRSRVEASSGAGRAAARARPHRLLRPERRRAPRERATIPGYTLQPA
jgi:hypothetical protein